jgi:hypothetical protein
MKYAVIVRREFRRQEETYHHIVDSEERVFHLIQTAKDFEVFALLPSSKEAWQLACNEFFKSKEFDKDMAEFNRLKEKLKL